jgi:hypothetical protein
MVDVRDLEGTTMRHIVLALCAVLSLAACTATEAAPSATTAASVTATSVPAASLDVTGIPIVGRDYQMQSGSRDETVSAAFDQAFHLAEQGNPNDLGYPWIDPSTGGLVVSAATARGRTVLESTSFGVPVRIRDVAHSYAELQRIQDDATRLNAQGVTDAALIYETGPDFRDDRTWITIARLSRPLLDELARRFPPDALIVVVDPTRYPLPLDGTASPWA